MQHAGAALRGDTTAAGAARSGDVAADGRSRDLPSGARRCPPGLEQQPRRVAQPFHVEPGLASQHGFAGRLAVLPTPAECKRVSAIPVPAPVAERLRGDRAAEPKGRTTRQMNVVLGNQAVNYDNNNKKAVHIITQPFSKCFINYCLQ